jgi:hypothetical protein
MPVPDMLPGVSALQNFRFFYAPRREIFIPAIQAGANKAGIND